MVVLKSDLMSVALGPIRSVNFCTCGTRNCQHCFTAPHSIEIGEKEYWAPLFTTHDLSIRVNDEYVSQLRGLKNGMLPRDSRLYIQKGLDEILRKELINASYIVDHKSYKESSSWFMFVPLLYCESVRRHYDVESKMTLDMRRLISKKLFDIQRSSLIDLFTIFAGYEFMFNPSLQDSVVRTNDSVEIAGNSNPVALDFMIQWGMPIANS